jgi:hypothetical protein
MSIESSEQRAKKFNHLARTGLIGAAVGFGSLIALVALPIDPKDSAIGRIVAIVGVLLIILSAVILITAIVARDLPVWKQNRWRFSLGSLFNVMLSVTLVLGSMVAAVNEVSASKIFLALGMYFVLATVITWIYISWARVRHFNEMNAQGRYLDWGTVAEHLIQGDGTVLLGRCHRVSTLWWSDRKINTLDEARSAIDSDAFITICPKQSKIAKWVKSNFPAATVIDLETNTIHSCSTGGKFR